MHPKNETLFPFLRNVEAYYFLLKKAKFYFKIGTDNKKASSSHFRFNSISPFRQMALLSISASSSKVFFTAEQHREMEDLEPTTNW